jgi:hypothetical protein
MKNGERATGEAGSALVIVLLATLLLSALGTAMIVIATADTLAAANQRDSRVVLYAAEGALERAAADLVLLTDWNAVLAGDVRSPCADGPPTGGRRLPDGTLLALETMPNLAGCGVAAGCSPAALDAVTADRPWGRNNPRWRLFAYGPFSGSSSQPTVYTVVIVGDDPGETDNDPARDAAAGSPGGGVLVLRAEGFGPGGSRRTVEAVVARGEGIGAPRFLSWLVK